MLTLKTKEGLEVSHSQLLLMLLTHAPIMEFPRVQEHQRVMVGMVTQEGMVELEWVVVEEGFARMPPGLFQNINASANGLVDFTFDHSAYRYLHLDAARGTGAEWFDYDFLAFSADRVAYAPAGARLTVVETLSKSFIYPQ